MKHKFLWLLISLVLMFLIYPFFEGGGMESLILAILFTIILLAGVYAASQKKIHLAVGLLLAIPSFITDWLLILTHKPVFYILSGVFSMAFFIFVIVVIMYSVMTAKEVTGEILLGAVNVYLLLGLVWSVAYSLLYFIDYRSFSLGALCPVEHDVSWTKFLYFSFTTLTTLGIGDIIPASAFSQSFTSLEAVVGVLFIAVLIGRLVGLYLYESRVDAARRHDRQE